METTWQKLPPHRSLSTTLESAALPRRGEPKVMQRSGTGGEEGKRQRSQREVRTAAAAPMEWPVITSDLQLLLLSSNIDN